MTAAEMADIRELRAELLENHREIRADLAALTSELRESKEQSTKELGELRITSAIITTKASMGSVLVAYGISLVGLALALANYVSK